MPLDIEITTVGAAVLGLCTLGSTLVWRLVPPRRTRMASKDAVNLAIMSTEIAHIRGEITEIKTELRELRQHVASGPLRPR